MPRYKRGFTLIEVLLVVAIIGIMAGLVITFTDTTRNKARDGRIQASIFEIKSLAELVYNDKLAYSYVSLCAGDDTLNDARVPYGTEMDVLETDIDLQNRSMGGPPACYASGTDYCVSATLATGGSICISRAGQTGNDACTAAADTCDPP